MKKRLFSLVLLGLLIFSCNGNNVEIETSNVEVEGLSLYWDHEIFGEPGRRLRFEFYETKAYEYTYELVFDYTINGNDITIELLDKISEGECQKFPTASGIDSLCLPKGRFYIEDKYLEQGNYSLIIKTKEFEISSGLTIDNEQFVLDIPTNERFSSSIKNVFPIPKNLLFGSVVFQGIENTESATEFFNALTSLGLLETTIPNYPYNHLVVDDTGRPVNKHWEPDNHSLKFLYKMNITFEEIFELSKKHFENSNLNIYLYSSKGDEARLSKNDGIVVSFVDE